MPQGRHLLASFFTLGERILTCGELWFLQGFLRIPGANRGVNGGEMWWSCGDLLVGSDSKHGMKNGTAFRDLFCGRVVGVDA
jgi:hypothetical protein